MAVSGCGRMGFGEATDYGRTAIEFVDAVARLDSKADVLAALQAAMGEFGFEYYAISDLPYPFQAAVPQVLGLKVPIGWAEVYLAQKYYLFDPVVRSCREGTQPFEWKDIRIAAHHDPRAGEVMARARDFGLVHGLALPIRNLSGRTSCVSLSSSDTPYVNRFTKPAIHLMALYAFEQLRELDMGRSEPRDVLSPREREVLTWAAAGKSAAAIAGILGIGERTVIAHTVNATQKLGAANKTQAVALALHCKLIAL